MSESFFVDEHVTSEVQGQERRFLACSLDEMFKLKSLAQPLAEALTAFFSNTKDDAGIVSRNTQTPEGASEGEYIRDAISLDVIKFRAEQKKQALANLFEAFSSEDNQLILAGIIKDSLRGHEEVAKMDVKAFKKTIPAPAFGSLLVGVAKANKGVIGPLSEILDSSLAESLKTKIQEKLLGDEPESDEDKPQTAGNSSKTI